MGDGTISYLNCDPFSALQAGDVPDDVWEGVAYQALCIGLATVLLGYSYLAYIDHLTLLTFIAPWLMGGCITAVGVVWICSQILTECVDKIVDKIIDVMRGLFCIPANLISGIVYQALVAAVITSPAAPLWSDFACGVLDLVGCQKFYSPNPSKGECAGTKGANPKKVDVAHTEM
jgi:energy-converting hydrogenase Eha subunit E